MGLLRRTFLPAAMLMALFAAVIAGFALTANAQTGVSEAPRLDTMQVIDGEVFDSVIVGNRVIVVGDFTQVRNPGGNTINQPYIAAYNVNTGQFDGSYRPSVDNFVNAIANDGSDVFIVGQFGNVDGESHRRIAKLNSNGDVVSAFDASMGTTPNTLAIAHARSTWVAGSLPSMANREKPWQRSTQRPAIWTQPQTSILSSVFKPVVACR